MKINLRLLSLVVITAVLAISCGVKDSSIKASIETIKQGNPSLEGLAANVEKGVVTLTGQLKDGAAQSLAASLVKGVKGVKEVKDNTTIAPPPPPPVAPVVITADDPLLKGVTDAVKDFPGVTAAVKDGVITLTGEIKRTSLQKLMMGLNALRPKKIENKLTIK